MWSKEVFICFLLFFVVSDCFGLKINKVKIIGNEHTSSQMILRLASEFLENRDFSEEELENIARRVEERLRNTTWFYSSRVYIVPSSAGEEYRNVVIEVVEGFLLRFSGGNAYGMFGIDNVWGNGEKFLVFVGYNRQGVVFEFDNVLEYFFVEGRLGNFDGIYYEATHPKNVQKVGVEGGVGYRFNWDSKVSVVGGYESVFDGSYNYLFNSYYGGIRYVLDVKDELFSAYKGYWVLVEANLLSLRYWVVRTDSRFFVPVYSDFVSVGFRNSLGVGYNLPAEYKLNVVGADGVRGEIRSSMFGDVKILGNIEIKTKIAKFTIMGIFNVLVEGVLFMDFGRCFDIEEVFSLFSQDFPTAFGGGVRMYFLEPVFLPMRFEVGVDKYGGYALFFTINEPF